VYLRIRQVALLTVPVVRTIPWAPVATAMLLSTLAFLPAVAGAAAPASQVWALRIAAFLLGASASFALVESLVPVATTPTPRWLRQWLRTVIALAPVGAVWPALFALAAHTVPGPGLPLAGPATEGAACALTGVAGAAVAARRGGSRTTALAGPAAQATFNPVTLLRTGARSPWALPTTGAHLWWIVAAPVPLLVLAAANLELRTCFAPRRSRPRRSDRRRRRRVHPSATDRS